MSANNIPLANAIDAVISTRQVSEPAKTVSVNGIRDNAVENTITEHRPSVLENHGYTLGRTIGSGSYATVKVT